MMVEILNGKDITQIVPQTTFKTELSPVQLRIQSTETLSSLEFDVFQVSNLLETVFGVNYSIDSSKNVQVVTF